MNQFNLPPLSKRSTNPAEAQRIIDVLVREIKVEPFSARDYGWKEEVVKRQKPDYRHPVGEPYGESPLLSDGSFQRVTAEYVLGHEGWDDTVKTFIIPEFNQDTHNGEFDLQARRRMIIGSKWLAPLIWENLEHQSRKKILEFGPFTDPLVTSETYSRADINYIDNENKILDYLKQRFPRVTTLKGNFSELDKIPEIKDEKFDAMIMSQVLNYIDFRKLLGIAKSKLASGGLIFINNVAHYGIPEYFAPEGRRPNSEWDTLQALQDLGFEIKEWIIIPTTNFTNQPLDRLLIVATSR